MYKNTPFASHVFSHHDMQGQHANPVIDERGVQYAYNYLGGLGACCRKILRLSCHERASGVM